MYLKYLIIIKLKIKSNLILFRRILEVYSVLLFVFLDIFLFVVFFLLSGINGIVDRSLNGVIKVVFYNIKFVLGFYGN